MVRRTAISAQSTLLIGILVTIVMSVTSLTVYFLYETSLAEQRERLVVTAKSQARLMEAVARFDRIHHPLHKQSLATAFDETVSQIRDAHRNFIGFGETGEFTLARLDGDRIVFLLSQRHDDLESPAPIQLDSKFAEPTRLALQGKSGTTIGFDYRGVTVLAAYEPVAELNLGIVAKIDMAEIHAPFIRAGVIAFALAFLLTVTGAWLFQRIAGSMVRRIEESEKRLRIAAEGTQDGLWLWNIKNNHEWHAPRWKELLGFDKDQDLPENVSTWESRIHPDDRERTIYALNRHLEDDLPYDSEHRLLTKSGEYKWFRDRGIAIRDVFGKPVEMGGSIQDISQLKAAEEKLQQINKELEELSLKDALTNVANRRMFDRLMSIEWLRARRSKQPLSLLFVDIDFFKQYNDRYGHQPGDECLKRVAECLKGVANRPADLVVRYGGEEFILLLPETGEDQAYRLAEMCRSNVSEMKMPHEASQASDVVTISVGLSTAKVDASMQPESLIETADKALYRAKNLGRNRVERL